MGLVTSSSESNNHNLYFSKIELAKILNLYSKGVSRGEWKDYAIKPNYKVDHEGMIRQTAPSRMSDIVCEKDDIIDLVEVTMLQDGHGQGSNEIPKIRRHVNDKKTEFPNSNVSSTYITPRMHEDALFLIRAAGLENVIIKPFDIGEFIQKLETDSVLN